MAFDADPNSHLIQEKEHKEEAKIEDTAEQTAEVETEEVKQNPEGEEESAGVEAEEAPNADADVED